MELLFSVCGKCVLKVKKTKCESWVLYTDALLWHLHYVSWIMSTHKLLYTTHNARSFSTGAENDFSSKSLRYSESLIKV